jgi:hypothetical protein
MTRLAVTGYASLDYVMHLDGMVAPDQTTTGRRTDAAWPRVGGCPSYISKAVARMGGAERPGRVPAGASRQTGRTGGRDFHSASERLLIGETCAVLVETRGSDRVVVTAGGKAQELPVLPIDIADTTGAGDSFAGGYIAGEMTGAHPVEAAGAGIKAAAALLADRKRRQSS